MKTAPILIALVAALAASPAYAQDDVSAAGVEAVAAPVLDDAQRLFYNGRYEAADALTLELCSPDLEGLAGCELRSSTLLFQIKRAVAGTASSSALPSPALRGLLRDDERAARDRQ